MGPEYKPGLEPIGTTKTELMHLMNHLDAASLALKLMMNARTIQEIKIVFVERLNTSIESAENGEMEVSEGVTIEGLTNIRDLADSLTWDTQKNIETIKIECKTLLETPDSEGNQTDTPT